jgi:hypothetical protein
MAAEQQARLRMKDTAVAEASEKSHPRNPADALRVPDELPPGSLELFTTTVQPVLLNRCSTASCHGSKSPSNFRLHRPGMGENMSRRVTLHNLHAAMAQVDRQAPTRSPLLTAPAGPHAEMKSAVFAAHEARQLERLATWVEQVTGGAQVLQTAFEQPTGQALMQRLPNSSWSANPFDPFGNQANPLDRQVVPSAAQQTGDGPAPGPFPTSAATGAQTLPSPNSNDVNSSPVNGQQVAPGASQRDPFDPAAFNQRHHGASPPTSSENSPRSAASRKP